MEIQEKLKVYLDRYAEDKEKLFQALDKLLLENEQKICPVITHVLRNPHPSDDRYDSLWCDVITRYCSLETCGHDASSFQAAICEYFNTTPENFENILVVDLEKYEQTVTHSRVDSLTGLYNKRIYQEMLNREFARTMRHGNDLSIIFFDLDDFKQVNDQFGHLVGDLVLKAVAGVISENRRQEDIVARYGGEEIVLLLPETGKQKAHVIGERIRKAVENLRVNHEGLTVQVTLSGGLASFPYDSTTVENLQVDADNALFRAKKAGKNQIFLFSSNMRRHIRVAFADKFLVNEMGFNGSNMKQAKGINISGGGMLFKSQNCFEKGVKLQVKMALRPDVPFFIVGQVVRTLERGPRQYDTALLFHRGDRVADQELLLHVMGSLTSKIHPSQSHL